MDEVAKTVLITGCSSGIGRSIAIHFARIDWQVIATVRHQDDADKLQMLGYTNIQPELLDLNDEQQILQLVDKLETQQTKAGLDVLINNAAFAEACPLEYSSTNHLQQHFSANVIGPMVLTRACLPLLKKRSGRIININSALSHLGSPLMGIYNASKSAMYVITECLRVELQRTGIHVISIEPGLVDTTLQDKIIHSYRNLFKLLPEEARFYYQASSQKYVELQKGLIKNATKPAKVAQTVIKAVNANEPKPQYWVGYDSRILHLLKPVLSMKLRDKIWKEVIGI